MMTRCGRVSLQEQARATARQAAMDPRDGMELSE